MANEMQLLRGRQDDTVIEEYLAATAMVRGDLAQVDENTFLLDSEGNNVEGNPRSTMKVPTGTATDAVEGEYGVCLGAVAAGEYGKFVMQGPCAIRCTDALALGTVLGAPNASAIAAAPATGEKILARTRYGPGAAGVSGDGSATPPELTPVDFRGIGGGLGTAV